ncbi:hypothetical protein RFI_33266 [Reticulomyxa filosa]|uniref:Uncharacterized protein n=1 Tax=Reticulomyxa filosa TaxID=46433 RepID=X6LRV4_RETFI|nr:hypothetical protein RFI_33266 [Reticulomyxa filosa]|eukprot:ETO04136.1 hypothetical protein RFI_33266 [Reticulomyxa filosa]
MGSKRVGLKQPRTVGNDKVTFEAPSKQGAIPLAKGSFAPRNKVVLSEKPDEDKHEAMISFSNLDSEKQKSIELKPGDSNGTDDFKSPSSVHPNETVSFVTFSGKDQVLVDLLIRYVVLSICSAVTACVTVCVLGYLLTQKYHMSNGIEAFAVILSSQIAFVTICQCFVFHECDELPFLSFGPYHMLCHLCHCGLEAWCKKRAQLHVANTHRELSSTDKTPSNHRP